MKTFYDKQDAEATGSSRSGTRNIKEVRQLLLDRQAVKATDWVQQLGSRKVQIRYGCQGCKCYPLKSGDWFRLADDSAGLSDEALMALGDRAFRNGWHMGLRNLLGSVFRWIWELPSHDIAGLR